MPLEGHATLEKDLIVEPRETVSSQHLGSVKRRFVLGLNLLSMLGCGVAGYQVLEFGVGAMELALLSFMYTLTGIGISVGYHRYFSHGAFDTTPWLRTGLAILGSMAGHGPVVSWTATHRCHHKHSDVAEDPHSPHLHGRTFGGRMRGLWHAHMGWLLNSDLPNSMIFAKDLLQDPVLSRVNRLYLVWVALGLVIPAVVGGMLTGSLVGAGQGLLWGGAARFFLGFHATSSVNSITHSFGSRAFETRERSTNLAMLAIPTFGEGWHNNHHAFPSSAKFGLRWWQLDLGYLLIRVLESLGLAWNVRRATASP